MENTIELADGIIVEVSIDKNGPKKISTSSRIKESFSDIQPFLKKVLSPITNSWREINKEMAIEGAKVTIGIKVGLDGNFLLAKSTSEAHLEIELSFKGLENE